MTRSSFRTSIKKDKRELAEWFTLNDRPGPDREQIAAEIGVAVSENVPVLCICCDELATKVLGDWDVCDLHYDILTAPWPEELDLF
jgi:hypothetical protein